MKDVPISVKTSLQQWTKIIAMNVRNRMEIFNCQHLTDDQMKELNPIIRNAIYEALHALFLLRSGTSESQKLYGALNVSDWLMRAPDYWELPGLPDKVAQRLQQLTVNDLRAMPSMSTEKSRREFETFYAHDLSVF